jgi:glycogen operon protein
MDRESILRCLRRTRQRSSSVGEIDDRGEPIVGDTLLILLNAHHEAIPFQLPLTKQDLDWELLFDTSAPRVDDDRHPPRSKYQLEGRSMVVLITRREAMDKQAESEPSSAEVETPIQSRIEQRAPVSV